MKIALIGTHCTGKTGLVAQTYGWFIRNGKSVNIIKEMSENPPTRLPINEETTLAAQRAILFFQMGYESALSNYHDHLISDRGTIDNWMYLQRVREKIVREGVPISFAEEKILGPLEDLSIAWSSTYDYQFVLSPGRYKIEQNRIRSIDPVFQGEINDSLTKYIDEHTFPGDIYSLSSARDYFDQVKETIRRDYPEEFKID
jgi:hypothetical protein